MFKHYTYIPLKLNNAHAHNVILNFHADPLVITKKWIRERLNLTIDTLGKQKSLYQ